ncbi:MAG: DarT ssDNA thymidine ADP-ribosyltransferase family protein [Gaiellaceae bacterium]
MSCDRACQTAGLTARNIGYSSLKELRMRTPVEVEPRGTLGDYVPFYFGTRSPMMYVYSKGYVTGQPENTDNLVYFVSRAEIISESPTPFAFSDGHPVREPKAFFNDLKDRNWSAGPDRWMIRPRSCTTRRVDLRCWSG